MVGQPENWPKTFLVSFDFPAEEAHDSHTAQSRERIHQPNGDERIFGLEVNVPAGDSPARDRRVRIRVWVI